jgi:hypothetical protein
VGDWYHVAIVFDATTMKHFVNNPIGQGGTSLGCRYTQRAFRKGAIRKARFTPRALTPAEFMPIN